MTDTAVPEACPGTASEAAGSAAACEGCPNQNICKTAPKGPDPAIEEIHVKLATVKHKVLVLSGKGGVGKSTLTGALSVALARVRDEVGVIDADICGPSMPRVLGVRGEDMPHSNAGWSPVYCDDNLALVSAGLMLESEKDAIIWRGPKKNGLIKDFLLKVDWGDLDYLVVDTPPGTSDEHLSLVTYLKSAKIDGCVLVTTPQEVALMDVRKEIDFCRKVRLPIIGVVENMSGFVCPACDGQSELFPATTGGAEQMCKDLDVPFLGKVPLDPRVGQCTDAGRAFIDDYPDAIATRAYTAVANRVISFCEKPAL